MLFRILFWAFILVMVFRFIARFLFPVIKITKATHDGMRRMQDQMEQMRQQQQRPPKQQTSQGRAVEGDYIDYEEVK
jgi:hypothetical protein